MVGSSTLGRTEIGTANSRWFRYEVTGLSQSTETDTNDYPFRSSSSVFVTVPYARMNQEMRRITRMGGTIVKIEPVTVGA